MYSRLLAGLLATVKLDAPYPVKKVAGHARKSSSKSSSSLSSNATSPSRSSISPVRRNLTHPNVHQSQLDDGQHSSGDGSSVDSPSSMKGLHVQEFFAPPLPFDGELLHSMQNLTNSTEWEGLALPGAHFVRIDVFLTLTAPVISSRVELDGWFTAIRRNATVHAAAWGLPSTPRAGCI